MSLDHTLTIRTRGGTTWAVYRGEEFLGTIECEGDSEADADVIEAAAVAFPAPMRLGDLS